MDARLIWPGLLVSLVACVGDTPASNLPDDAGAVDGSPIDSSTQDVSAVDASADATVDAPVTFCSGSSHAFCADFDSVAKVDQGWNGALLQNGGSLALDQGMYASKPVSLNCTLPGLSGTAVPQVAFLGKTIPVQPTQRTLHLELDMRHTVGATVPAPTNLHFFGAYLNDVSLVYIFVDAAGWHVVVRATSTDVVFPCTPIPNTGWVHLALDVVYASGTGGSVKLDAISEAGVVTLFNKTGFETSTEATAQVMDLNIGIVQNSDPSPGFIVHFDNVVADVK